MKAVLRRIEDGAGVWKIEAGHEAGEDSVRPRGRPWLKFNHFEPILPNPTALDLRCGCAA